MGTVVRPWSTIDGELLDKLDAVGRAVRGGGIDAPHRLPFGGAVQIDPGFSHLPPRLLSTLEPKM